MVLSLRIRKLLKKRHIKSVETTDEYFEGLLRLVDRDLVDCRVRRLSNDRKYAVAYGAALNLANYVIRKQGYQVALKPGHHELTLKVAREMSVDYPDEQLVFADRWRRKRNKVDYHTAHIVTDAEVCQLIDAVEKFRILLAIRENSEYRPSATRFRFLRFMFGS